MNRDEAARMHVAQGLERRPGSAEVAGAANEASERAVEAGQTPVPVRIPSDGRTGMGIRGVGRTGRTIELRPGGHVLPRRPLQAGQGGDDGRRRRSRRGTDRAR